MDSVNFPKELQSLAHLAVDIFTNPVIVKSRVPFLVACNKQGMKFTKRGISFCVSFMFVVMSCALDIYAYTAASERNEKWGGHRKCTLLINGANNS